MLLNKDQILKADDLPFKDVEVPEWGGTVRVRAMTGAERESFEAAIYDMSGEKAKFLRQDFRAKLLCRTIVDEQNKRLFSESDIAALSAKSAKVLDRLMEVAQGLSGLSREETDKIKNA